ncbi:unnamed protein product [Rotaria sordida]|uniref:Uncharacterized protein n=1 Tax=Rotaria sordida TaxID=392033 RepID=A0A818TIH3_9BILA|nr:unnamed protein product [Rotaria sordida]
MNSAENQTTSPNKQSRSSLDEHDLTNKRLKIDHADQNNQTHQVSTTKNQSTYVKTIQKNVFKKQSQFFIESLLTDQQQIDVKQLPSIFRSYNQTLQFNFWGLHLSDFCFGQLTGARALMPKLTNVTNLDLNSWDMSKLDAIIFVTWLKLVPNVRQLDMTSMDDSAKMILAKQLRQLVAIDNRLMYILCRIRRVRIFTSTDKTDYPRQQFTYEIFTKIFPKAIVHRQ